MKPIKDCEDKNKNEKEKHRRAKKSKRAGTSKCIDTKFGDDSVQATNSGRLQVSTSS
jgi:hypothetical protein